MEIVKILNYREKRFGTAIALGNFDGVHIAHQKLVLTIVKNGNMYGLKPSILLFNVHTKSILNGKSPQLLSTREKKLKILENLGAEIIYEVDFNELRKLSPEEFVKDILIDRLNVKLVAVGFDYRFGYKASGTPEDLKEFGKKYGFEVIVLDPIFKDDIVSSTRIREFLRDGDIEKANMMLGYNYFIKGKVMRGKQRGTGLGFPTANLEIPDGCIIPKIGVYETRVKLDDKEYLGATSVGKNSTFEDDISIKIETHIIGLNKKIYGEVIELEFIRYLREEIKFDSADELKRQMIDDIKAIKSEH